MHILFEVNLSSDGPQDFPWLHVQAHHEAYLAPDQGAQRLMLWSGGPHANSTAV